MAACQIFGSRGSRPRSPIARSGRMQTAVAVGADRRGVIRRSHRSFAALGAGPSGSAVSRHARRHRHLRSANAHERSDGAVSACALGAGQPGQGRRTWRRVNTIVLTAVLRLLRSSSRLGGRGPKGSAVRPASTSWSLQRPRRPHSGDPDCHRHDSGGRIGPAATPARDRRCPTRARNARSVGLAWPCSEHAGSGYAPQPSPAWRAT
jgi:hypothetical protein